MTLRRSLAIAAVLAWALIVPCGDTPARGRDLRFAQGNSSLCVPFDGANRQIAVEARVNGREGLRFVLDTGAEGAVLDDQVAASLGLAAVGVHRSRGAGGMQEGSTVHGVDLGLPGLELIDLTMDTLSLQELSARVGRRMDGILGDSLFRQVAFEIDFPRRCVSFYDGAGFHYQGTGTVLPLKFVEGLPYVTARAVFPGGRAISGRFAIDTGSSAGLILSPELVEREHLRETMGKTLEVQAHGVGGGVRIAMGRIERFDLADFSFSNPIALFQPLGTGRVSAPGTVGNIGWGVLSRFKVTFDYPRRRMILEPADNLEDPFEADMSGLTLFTTPPDFRRITVARVQDGSPGLDAGVLPGDLLVTVDGVPASEIAIGELRERLRREGVTVRLGLQRGTESVAVTLLTRRLI